MWTKHEDRELVRCWSSMSAREIGAKLGRTRNAVIGRMHRINGTYKGRRHKHHERLREEAAARKREADNIEQAALDKMQKSLSRGVARNDAINIAVSDGAKQTAVAAVFGVTRQAISLIVGGYD
jgi:hypothetical protein